MRNRHFNQGVKKTLYGSLEAFQQAEALSNGYLSVAYEGYPIDSYIRQGTTKTMIVVFHAALTGKSIRYPVFQGVGMLRGIDVTRVSIADPTIGKTNLALSWYAGNREQPKLQRVIAGIVDKIAQLADVEHIIFFGGSGGGFAALQVSRAFPGSLALPMNPQTSISKYLKPAVDRYTKVAWGSDDLGSLSIDHDLTGSYGAGFSNTIGYVQNSRDLFHVENHAKPFFDALPKNDETWLLEGAWGDDPKSQHVPPPKDKIHSIMQSVCSCNGDWRTGLTDVQFRPLF